MFTSSEVAKHPVQNAIILPGPGGAQVMQGLALAARIIARAVTPYSVDLSLQGSAVCVSGDDIGGLIEAIGVDKVVFGSDFPHPEGLAEPRSYVDHLPPGLSDEDLAAIMGGNLAHAMRISVPV